MDNFEDKPQDDTPQPSFFGGGKLIKRRNKLEASKVRENTLPQLRIGLDYTISTSACFIPNVNYYSHIPF